MGRTVQIDLVVNFSSKIYFLIVILSQGDHLTPNQVFLQTQFFFILMLRNSLEKSQQNYRSVPSSPGKNHRLLKTISSLNQSQCRLEEYSNVQYASTKKLQTYNVFNQKHKFIYTSVSQPYEEAAKLCKPLSKTSKTSKMEQKLYRTQQKSNLQKDNESIKKVRISKDFIENMPRDTLFYCTHCFQFIFDIEKKRHYPECQDAVQLINRGCQEFYVMAQHRLTSIVELSRYTNTKSVEINNLYESIVNQKWEAIQRIQYASAYQFFKLEQIEMAFAYTCNILLKGINRKPQSSLFSCF